MSYTISVSSTVSGFYPFNIEMKGSDPASDLLKKAKLDHAHCDIAVDVPTTYQIQSYNIQTHSYELGPRMTVDHPTVKDFDSEIERGSFIFEPGGKYLLSTADKTINYFVNERLATKFEVVAKSCGDIDHCPGKLRIVVINGESNEVEFNSSTTTKQLHEKVAQTWGGLELNRIRLISYVTKKSIPADENTVISTGIQPNSSIALIIKFTP